MQFGKACIFPPRREQDEENENVQLNALSNTREIVRNSYGPEDIESIKEAEAVELDLV